MAKSFVRSVITYSTLMWAWMLLALSPMFALAWICQEFHPGMITSFNLFLVCMMTTMGLFYLLGPLLGALAPPKLELKHSQWEIAFEVIKWLKKHEIACVTLIMGSLVAVFVPMEFLWAWFNSIGLLASAFSAFVLLFTLILPFFIMPSFFVSCIYDSVVHPKKISGISQLSKIINEIYSKPEWTGEALEAAKHRSVLISKRARWLAVPLLASLVFELALLQLIELGYISKQIETIMPFVMIAQMLLLGLLMFAGAKKKTELDLWFDKNKQESTRLTTKSSSKQFNFRLGKSIEAAKKAVINIEENWFYRLMVITGVVLGLLLTVLALFHIV
jgi:hypothetical protein